jgi:hypothetical protein
VADGVVDRDAGNDQADPQRDADDHGRHHDTAEPEAVLPGVPRPAARIPGGARPR